MDDNDLPAPIKRRRTIVSHYECPQCGQRLGVLAVDSTDREIAYHDSTEYDGEQSPPVPLRTVRTFLPCECQYVRTHPSPVPQNSHYHP